MIEINGSTQTAAAGDVLFFHPGDTYKAYSKKDCCNFLVTFFTIDTGSTMNFLDMNDTSGIYHSTSIAKISNQFCEEYFEKYQGLHSPTLGQYASFLNLFSELSNYFGTQNSFRDSFESAPELRLNQLIAYIDAHITRNMPIKEMASFMSMSEKYFSTYFHSHIGMTPKQYLIKCRMKFALELLMESHLTLSAIAQTLNYSDPYSFSKAFKKYYSESPENFRKHYCKNYQFPSATLTTLPPI